MPIKLDAQLEKLLMESRDSDRISAELPRARVEIAVDLFDSSKGAFYLDVQGFTAEEGRSLRARYHAASRAYFKAGELHEKAVKAAQAEEKSDLYAELAGVIAGSDQRFAEAEAALLHGYSEAMIEVIRRGVVGWPEGQFEGASGPIEPVFVEVPSAFGPRRVLHKGLAILIAKQRPYEIVSQIFAVSDGDTPQTALEQWARGTAQKAEQARKEAAKASPPKPESAPEAHAAAPFEPKQKRPVRTQKGSPSRSPSPSPSESESASLLAKESTPKATDSEATTAPPAPTNKNTPVDADSTGAPPAQVEPSESTTTSPRE